VVREKPCISKTIHEVTGYPRVPVSVTSGPFTGMDRAAVNSFPFTTSLTARWAGYDV